MKSITVKQTINKGNYENLVVEITIDRPAGMNINDFIEMAKHQLDFAIQELNK